MAIGLHAACVLFGVCTVSWYACMLSNNTHLSEHLFASQDLHLLYILVLQCFELLFLPECCHFIFRTLVTAMLPIIHN